MKKNIYILAVFVLAGFIALSNAAGAGTAQGKDRTGSPVADGNCSSCHSGGSFGGAAALELVNTDGDVVTTYIPNNAYTVRLTATHSSTPSTYGFQAVVLDPENNSVGNWEQGSSYKVVPVNGRSYTEHNPASSSNTFEMNWVAPPAGTGAVSMFAAMLLANADSGTGGDQGVVATPLTLSENTNTNTQDLSVKEMKLTVFPNPVADALSYKITVKERGSYSLNITDLSGKVILQERTYFNQGENAKSLQINTLPQGNYILNIFDEKHYATQHLIKL